MSATPNIDKVQAAVAATKDTYVKVTAGDLAAACREAGPDAVAPGTLGAHAAEVCQIGKDGPDTVMMIHRAAHTKPFTAVAAAPLQTGS